jgi:hypothetical protein
MLYGIVLPARVGHGRFVYTNKITITITITISITITILILKPLPASEHAHGALMSKHWK